MACIEMLWTIEGVNRTSPRYEWPITPLGEDTVREDSGGDAAYMAEVITPHEVDCLLWFSNAAKCRRTFHQDELSESLSVYSKRLYRKT